MSETLEVLYAVGSMPLGSLVALVVLGSFALAAFAIYAVMQVAKKG